jgi:excisionase family DNA binding protein
MIPATNRLTNKQAAEYLGITAGTLHVWRCENRYAIPFLRIGSKIRYRTEDLDAFLASRLVRPRERKAKAKRHRASNGQRRGSR